jgi:hypothetical protein
MTSVAVCIMQNAVHAHLCLAILVHTSNIGIAWASPIKLGMHLASEALLVLHAIADNAEDGRPLHCTPATVDLPTPPLPEATATTCCTSARPSRLADSLTGPGPPAAAAAAVAVAV